MFHLPSSPSLREKVDALDAVFGPDLNDAASDAFTSKPSDDAAARLVGIAAALNSAMGTPGRVTVAVPRDMVSGSMTGDVILSITGTDGESPVSVSRTIPIKGFTPKNAELVGLDQLLALMDEMRDWALLIVLAAEREAMARAVQTIIKSTDDRTAEWSAAALRCGLLWTCRNCDAYNPWDADTCCECGVER